MNMRPFQVSDQNAVYFLTLTIVEWVDIFTRREYKVEVIDSLNFCMERKGLEIFAWCLMSNHLHLLCRSKEAFRLSDTIQDFKKFTARKILGSLEKESIESRAKWILGIFREKGASQSRISKYPQQVAVGVATLGFMRILLHIFALSPSSRILAD